MRQDKTRDAYCGAAQGGPGVVPFMDLHEGEQFMFAHRHADDAVFTAGRRGWYRDADGKAWRTGRATWVRRVCNDVAGSQHLP